MNLKVPILLFVIGIIVAFWPGASFVLKFASATLILFFAALPLTVKKKDMTLISVAAVTIIVLVFYFIKTSTPASAEAFMKDKTDFDVRYADVEKYGAVEWHPYFVKWESKCISGEFAYCRIASYVPRVKREKRAEELLRMGCTNGDFLSCYNYFYYDEFGREDRTVARITILNQCKNSDLSEEFKKICEKVSKL